jgi:hypothetical protein
MKFPQLPLGARFRWDGELYRKTGPMTAHAEAGRTRKLVPRSAVVEPVEGSNPAPPSTEHFSALAVQAALDAYQDSLRAYAETLEGPRRAALEQQMDAAERAFGEALRR